MKKRGKAFFVFLAAALLSAWAGPSLAQEKFPSRPISIIIPWPPGGAGTINAQLLQPYLEKALPGNVLLVNKPGGGTTIAFNYVANSPADGYTVGIVNPSLITTQYTIKTGISYERFAPIINTVAVPAGVVVRADAPWKSFKEFVEYGKANPGKIQMANSGYAAMYHIGALGLEMACGVKFTHVPFKGAGPIITAMLGGHTDATVSEISTFLPYVESKKLRILAVSSRERNFALPDVPTFKEYGFELDVANWNGYVVPKGTPRDRIKILHDAFRAAMNSDEFKAYYKKQGGVLDYQGPDAFAAHLKRQDLLWKKIIDFSGFTPTSG